MFEWEEIELDLDTMFRFTGPSPSPEYELEGSKTNGDWDCRLHRFNPGLLGAGKTDPPTGVVVGEFLACSTGDAKCQAEALIAEAVRETQD